jgi:hypothetical protein
MDDRRPDPSFDWQMGLIAFLFVIALILTAYTIHIT